ncbi:MAG: LacI family DNA-binding transcriptional regulator [Oscillospiraceae bacterium]|nr:LacI family DNA-binding transcriptional regulator [Oscillospiraceae bacterium]
MQKQVKMADIAQVLGVSVVTVSKALSGKDGVGDELRAKIISTADEMGYQAKRKIIEENKIFKIGILTQQKFIAKGHSFYWSLYEKLILNLNEKGFLGILEIVSDEDALSASLPKLIQSEKIDGFILMGDFSSEYRDNLINAGLIFVGLDTFDSDCPYDTVISDGYYGMYIATKYLLKMGHRKISFVGTVGATASITDRFYGYCRAMREAGIKTDEIMAVPDRDKSGKLKVSLENVSEMPTAFACNCDMTAYYLINVLTENGYKVPDDVSIVGFDNDLFSEMARPKITTYAINLDKMTSACVEQLQYRLKYPMKHFSHIIISGYLIQRNSVKNISK